MIKTDTTSNNKNNSRVLDSALLVDLLRIACRSTKERFTEAFVQAGEGLNQTESSSFSSGVLILLNFTTGKVWNNVTVGNGGSFR